MNHSPFQFLVQGALSLTVAGTCLAQTPIPQQTIDAMVASADKAMRKLQGDLRLPGAALVLVHNGKTIFQRGYGVANIDARTPVDPEKTLFRIGSISKALSFLALTRLIDAGKVRREDDAGAYFEGIENPRGFDHPVRIRDLLTHTTGLDQIGADRHVFAHHLDLPARKARRPSLDTFLRAGNLRRVTPAGRYYRYDTYGSSLAGAIVGAVTKKSYARAMRDEMFAPLGMHRSFVEVDKEHFRDLATGYSLATGSLVAEPYEIYATLPASSIDATPADMGRLLQALTGAGANAHGRLFGEATAKAVLAPQFRPHPEFLGTTHGLHEARDASGLWEVPIRSVGHGGTMAGYRAQMEVVPEYGLGIFVVTNRSGDGGGGRVRFNPVIRTIFRSLPNPPSRKPHPVPQRRADVDLGEYVGDYYYGIFCHRATVQEFGNGAWRRGRSRAVRAEEGALRISGEEYLPRGGDVFVRTDGRRMVFFGRDARKKISHYVFSSSTDTFERVDPSFPYKSYPSLAQAVLDAINSGDITKGLERFRAARAAGTHYLREDEMNNVGYALMRADRTADAIAIFQLTAQTFPKSWNAHDSLGEAYANAGKTALAIASYERSLALNPKNAGGIAALKKLKK